MRNTLENAKSTTNALQSIAIESLGAVIGGKKTSDGGGGDNPAAGDNPFEDPWRPLPAGRPHKEDGGGTNPEPGEGGILEREKVNPPSGPALNFKPLLPFMPLF